MKDAEALRRAILRCWRSRGSDRVRAYEQSRGHTLGGLGIIVQEQIDSSTSGVLFTRDPAGNGGALVEYCAGAGEDLVAGRINPGRLLVDETGHAHHLARPATGAVMTDVTAASLAAEGRRVAAAFGAPQDIEWTIDGDGRAWFVQARPITATSFLGPGGGSQRPTREPRRILWSNANVNENFPEPITPLLYSVATAGYYHYFLNLGRAFGLSARRLAAIDEPLRQIIGVHGARCNTTSPASTPYCGRRRSASSLPARSISSSVRKRSRPRNCQTRAVRTGAAGGRSRRSNWRASVCPLPGSTCFSPVASRVSNARRTSMRAGRSRRRSHGSTARRSEIDCAASWRSAAIAGRTRRSPTRDRWSATPR
jgi:hypothetical protein